MGNPLRLADIHKYDHKPFQDLPLLTTIAIMRATELSSFLVPAVVCGARCSYKR